MEVVWFAVVVLATFSVAGVFVVSRARQRADAGQALIIHGAGETRVRFGDAFVLPIVARAEMLDITVKVVELERRGRDGLICRDNLRADVGARFFVRVNRTAEDVLKVAQTVGCARAGHVETLEELFAAKFSEAMKTVAKQLDFEDLLRQREDFRDHVLATIGRDLNGYALDDLVLDTIDQTPIEQLDPNNILDAEGIRRITERTAQEELRAAELRTDTTRRLKQLEVECREALLELERVEHDAMARFEREIGRAAPRAEVESKLEARIRAAVDAALAERAPAG